MTRILNLNNSVDIIANTISLIDGNDIIDINNLFSHSSEIDNYYTITDIDNIIDNYYTKQQIDISLGDYYTIQQLNTSFSNYYIISQIDNLLNDKANQSTTYTKTETDNEITIAVVNSYNSTLNEVYTKANVDALMSLKAPLTDTYTRSIIDAGLLLKADQATTYTKNEIDALNAGMYLKNEVNNLLDLKLNSSNILNYYNKTELDSMFANYYTRSYLDVVFGNIDNLLIDKANQSTTYTKNEIDALNAGMYWQYQVNDLFYNKTEIDNIIGNIASSSVENETPYYSGTTTLVPDTIPLVSANGKIKPLIGADDITVIDNGTYSIIHANFHASSSGGVGEILVAGDGTIKPIDVTGNISITSDIDNVTITVPPLESEIPGATLISNSGKIKGIATNVPLLLNDDGSKITLLIDTNLFADQATTYTKTETDTEINNRLLAYSQLPNSALIMNCMWGLSFLEPDNTTLFYAPCIAGARDVSSGDLWILTRSSSSGWGTYAINNANLCATGAMPLSSAMYIHPNGPTPPFQPNQSQIGWSGAFTFEYQLLFTDTYSASLTLTNNRDTDTDAPEKLIVVNTRWPALNKIRVKWQDVDNAFGQHYEEFSEDIQQDIWHHIAICYDGSNVLTCFF